MSKLTMVAVGAFALSGVFFVISVILWFRLGIRKVIGNLTGKTEKKMIAQMKENHLNPVENSKSASRKMTLLKRNNKEREKVPKLNDKQKFDEVVQVQKTTLLEKYRGETEQDITERLADKHADVDQTVVLDTQDANQTVVLEPVPQSENQTTVLGREHTEEQKQEAFNQTMVLNEKESIPIYQKARIEDVREVQTVVLDDTGEECGDYELTQDTMLIHTKEKV